jgi:hypothetical protein
VQPIPSGKLQKWAMEKSSEKVEESNDLRYEAYLSLLDHRIRRAWVRIFSMIWGRGAKTLTDLRATALFDLSVSERDLYI